MEGNDWLQGGEEWPEAFGFGDVAKGLLMPHTIPLKVANTILNQRKPAAPVVKHTQPPPIANNAREVQGQLTGLLRTVKGVEDKVDGVEQKVALVQRATMGNNEAERFQQSMVTALLAAAPLLEQRSWLGALAHAVTIVQGGKGIGAAFAAKPVSTIAWPVVAGGLYLGRQPRRPVIVASYLDATHWRVTMFSPDGGDIRYENGPNSPQASRNSQKYAGPLDVDKYAFPFRARAYVALRGSEQVEFALSKAAASDDVIEKEDVTEKKGRWTEEEIADLIAALRGRATARSTRGSNQQATAGNGNKNGGKNASRKATTAAGK